MNKPIIAAITVFTSWMIGVLAANYFKDQQPDWFIELPAAIFIALMMYAMAQRNQKKANSTSEPGDS